jgi:hypothetical protein
MPQGGRGLGMVNTTYHKSINKTLILENYFDGIQKRLLLCDNNLEHPGFAIGILRDFRKKHDKYMEHLASYQQSYPQYSCGYAEPSIAIGTRVRPSDRDRYD